MSEANRKEKLMRKVTLTGDCSICDRKEVKVRHFEVCAATGEGIRICLKCQPPDKGGDGPRYPHLNPAAVSVALADSGFRGPIKDTCLSMLTRWAQDRGLSWTIQQVFDDTGLTDVPTADGANGPRWFLLLWATRKELIYCQTCETLDELLFFPGREPNSIVAYCDRCHLARSLKDTHCCLRCGSGSDDLIFLPIDGSDFGIYLCGTCHLTAGRSPANNDSMLQISS